MNHTPTPWEVNGALIVKDCYGKVIADTDVAMDHPPKRYVPTEEQKANAAFIVRAVNAHDELLELVKQYYEILQAWAANDEEGAAKLREVKATIARAED